MDAKWKRLEVGRIRLGPPTCHLWREGWKKRESEGLKVKGLKVKEMLTASETGTLPDFKTLRLSDFQTFGL
jgi:hypothetical protein